MPIADPDTSSRTRGATRRAAAALTRKSTEQDASPFARILADLVQATPGARGAALVDYEGEAVDYAGALDPWELKVIGAHWQIVLRDISESKPFDSTRQLYVRSETMSFAVRRLGERYTLVLVAHPRAAFSFSERAFSDAERRVSLEAGFAVGATARWARVEVETPTTDKRRPQRILLRDAWQSVEVMGAVIGLRRGERGYRVRLSGGAEVSLVRERLGAWYAEEDVSHGEVGAHPDPGPRA